MAADGRHRRVDAEGFVELVGRAKDMIISGGFNIFPVDLEDELAKEPDVVEAAVIGVPSERWGETPVGFVTLSDGARECEAIMGAVNARLGKTQRLAQLHAIDDMPRSHIGKLLKPIFAKKPPGGLPSRRNPEPRAPGAISTRRDWGRERTVGGASTRPYRLAGAGGRRQWRGSRSNGCLGGRSSRIRNGLHSSGRGL